MQFATFENCTLAIVEFLDAARQTLEAGACWFTHPVIYEACMRACKRGVRLKLVVNFDHVNFHPQGLDFGALEKAGAQIFAYPGPELLHHKFAVADGCRVITGSYNWTRAEQLDHLACIEDLALAAQFSQALSKISGKSLPFADLSGKNPRQIAFQQLYKPIFWSAGELRRYAIAGGKTWLAVVKTEQEWRRWQTVQKHILPLNVHPELPPGMDARHSDLFRGWLETQALRPHLRSALIRYCFRLKEGDILFAVTPATLLLGYGIVGGGPEWKNPGQREISRFVQWCALKTPFFPKSLQIAPGKQGVKFYRGSALALIDQVERTANE